ncbi:hypothetical protein C6558_07635 [Ensifer sp. NM-2]|nr:hypothetical protein [Ensifer canadensis]PSS65269.1 hypothetical protein C6558_07635 [Ensifer sp. NM-2]
MPGYCSGGVIGRQHLPTSSLCLSQRSSGAASAAPEAPSFRRLAQVLHGADAPWLDFCDKHRNEGKEEALRAPQTPGTRGKRSEPARK